MADVRSVLRDESMAKLVERRAELSRSGCAFRFSADGVETEIGSAHHYRRHLGMIRRSNPPVGPVIRTVDPVIDAKPRIRNAGFLIHLREPRIQNLAQVGLAISIG